MNLLEKSKPNKKVKKDFYYLKVIVNNGYEIDPTAKETGVYACYGYKEKAAKARLTKLALENIGKAFKSALLIHKASNTIEYIFTPTHGQETWIEWKSRKEKEQNKGDRKKANTLLNMSILLKKSSALRSQLVAKNKAPFVTFPSMDVDLQTGEYGYHVALNNFIEKLREKKWRHCYVYAKIWKGKKEVARIDWLQNVTFYCTQFNKEINDLIYEST